MRLFYNPGTCSLATHIVLHELGIPFDIEPVDTVQARTESGRNYKEISPNGYVPALELDDGEFLTEGAAILQYLADQHPEAGLAPAAGSFPRVKLQQHLNFIASELHKTFGPLFYPDATEAEKTRAKEKLSRRFSYVDELLADGRGYLMDGRFSVADAYLFVVCNWSDFVGIDLATWPHIKSFVARIASRPAAEKAMTAEGLRR